MGDFSLEQDTSHTAFPHISVIYYQISSQRNGGEFIVKERYDRDCPVSPFRHGRCDKEPL